MGVAVLDGLKQCVLLIKTADLDFASLVCLLNGIDTGWGIVGKKTYHAFHIFVLRDGVLGVAFSFGFIKIICAGIKNGIF